LPSGDGHIEGHPDLEMEIIALARTITRLAGSSTKIEKISEDIGESTQSAQILEGKPTGGGLSELPTLKALASVESTEAPRTELSNLVVLCSFLGIAQYLVGGGDVLELILNRFVSGVGIWVILFGQPTIGLFDLLETGLFTYPQDFIVVFVSHLVS